MQERQAPAGSGWGLEKPRLAETVLDGLLVIVVYAFCNIFGSDGKDHARGLRWCELKCEVTRVQGRKKAVRTS